MAVYQSNETRLRSPKKEGQENVAFDGLATTSKVPRRPQSPRMASRTKTFFSTATIVVLCLVARMSSLFLELPFSSLNDEYSELISPPKPRRESAEKVFAEENELKPLSCKHAEGITILGERNVGSNWITTTMQKCFPNIYTSVHLHRYKHNFQEIEQRVKRDTLVLAINRNPYDWTEAMRHIPHHAPMHTKKKWKEFVTTPWTMPQRPERDIKLIQENGGTIPEGYICRDLYRYDQIIPCVFANKTEEYEKNPVGFSGWDPIYELRQDGSGKPFKNIVEMRAAKILNFVSVSDWKRVMAYIPLQYETLVDHGTDFLLTEIERLTGHIRECNATKGLMHGQTHVPAGKGRRRLTLREIPAGMLKWLDNNVDWEAEAVAGYRKYWRDSFRPPTELPLLVSFNSSQTIVEYSNLQQQKWERITADQSENSVLE